MSGGELRMTNYTLKRERVRVRGISRTYTPTPTPTPTLSRQGKGRKKNAIMTNAPDWYVSLTKGL
jgi:hypothetical protein